MLYVHHGAHISQSIEKAKALIDSLRAKRPDAAFVRITSDDWNASIIEEHLGGQGLFTNKYIIYLDRVIENIEAKESFVDFIPAMQESPNIFIVCEGKLNIEFKKAFEKNAEKVVVSDETVKNSTYGKSSQFGTSVQNSVAGKKDFNIFALADAFGARDRQKSWIIYREAVKNGLESESILGTLFWQAKSIALAAKCKTAGEAGLKPFVFDKSKRFSMKYSNSELEKLLKDLIVVYHDGHRGLIGLESAIERMTLKI